MGWFQFILSLVAFFAAHAIPVRPTVKAKLVRLLGQRGYSLIYSVVSFVILTWVVLAAGRAPFVLLWGYAPWQKYVALTLMLVATWILSLGIARPNPLSFGGAQNDQFSKEHAGIVAWVRHPLLVAIGFWAFAHVVANGDLAHVVLFGLFAAFSLLGMRIIDRRKRRLMGQNWIEPGTLTRRITVTRSGVLRILIGLGFYLMLVSIHGPVIGVSPLP
ncbi:MAG: NnrU family protein [Maritimibacter sp.]